MLLVFLVRMSVCSLLGQFIRYNLVCHGPLRLSLLLKVILLSKHGGWNCTSHIRRDTFVHTPSVVESLRGFIIKLGYWLVLILKIQIRQVECILRRDIHVFQSSGRIFCSSGNLQVGSPRSIPLMSTDLQSLREDTGLPVMHPSLAHSLHYLKVINVNILHLRWYPISLNDVSVRVVRSNILNIP